MAYYVLYSKDPWLLARMATDLRMEGYRHDNVFDRFCLIEVSPWMVVWTKPYKPSFYFLNHRGYEPDLRINLTSRNYLRVLGEILNNKK